MPQPTPSDAHIDAAMSNISLAYRNAQYIADELFPPVPVGKSSNKYFIFPKGSWFRNEAGVRAPGARAKRGGYVLSNDTYHCDEHAFAKEIPDEDREEADVPLTPDQDATEFATDKVQLEKEILVASKTIKTGNWTTDEDAEGHWAAGSGNTFIADVEKGIEAIRTLTGRYPNRMVIDSKTLSQIKQESTVLDRIKYTERGIVTPDLIAAMFDLEKVLIGTALYSSAEEKADGTDFTGVDIWENTATKGSACLLYVPPNPGKKIPSGGYLFTRKTRAVRRWREEAEHQDVIEAFEKYDAKVTGSDLGYLFYDTIAT